MKILDYFNVRTFWVLVISQVTVFFVIRFNIRFNLDLLLFSLAIAFPLAFSIQSAFRRRDRALEYFSLFRAGSIALYHSFRIAKDLSEHQQEESKRKVMGMVNQLLHQLEHRLGDYNSMQQKAGEVFEFIERHREDISNRNVLRMIRYLRDVTESYTFLLSLVRYRTLAGLRFYAITFIFIFPIVQAPILWFRLEPFFPTWCIYFFLGFSSLILVTLSNFQKLVEYPFDKKGIDAIRVRDFELTV